MSEVALVKGDEAKGADGDEANVIKDDAKGTPPVDAKGTPAPGDGKTGSDDSDKGGDEGKTVEELIYSEATLTAERETAERSGYDKARGEDADKRRERNQQIQRLIRAEEGDSPAVIRAVRSALSKLPELGEGESYSDADFEPTLKTVRDALGLAVDSALSVTDDIYTGEINRIFGKKEDSDAFWAEAKRLDPTMHVAEVLDLLIEARALESKKIRNAEPEELMKLNSKLASHINKHGDEKFKVGREQGRKDPPGDRSADSERTPSRSGNGLTPESYKQKLASGEPIDPKEVDAMTSKLLV